MAASRATAGVLATALLVLGACATAPTPAAACPPGYDRAQLEALRAAEWEFADENARRAFALALPACLASPDPFFRDGVGYEALAHMLRAKALDAATQNALLDDVLARLNSDDPHGFEQPFAALALSELVRADRLEPYLSEVRRAETLDRALAYFTAVRDYRGFDEREGWRHGVAHGADVLLQFSADARTSRDDLLPIRDAIASQVAPEGHFYIYGEPERLARPIIFMAQRGLISEQEWSEWFAAIRVGVDDPYMSQTGLTAIHNTRAFLNAILVGARLTGSEADDVLLPGAETAYRALP